MHIEDILLMWTREKYEKTGDVGEAIEGAIEEGIETGYAVEILRMLGVKRLKAVLYSMLRSELDAMLRRPVAPMQTLEPNRAMVAAGNGGRTRAVTHTGSAPREGENQRASDDHASPVLTFSRAERTGWLTREMLIWDYPVPIPGKGLVLFGDIYRELADSKALMYEQNENGNRRKKEFWRKLAEGLQNGEQALKDRYTEEELRAMMREKEVDETDLKE